jgi:hypothetical protein
MLTTHTQHVSTPIYPSYHDKSRQFVFGVLARITSSTIIAVLCASTRIIRAEIEHSHVLLRRNGAVRVGDDADPASRHCECLGHGTVDLVGIEIGEAVVLWLGYGIAVRNGLAVDAASGHSIGRGTWINNLEGRGGG